MDWTTDEGLIKLFNKVMTDANLTLKQCDDSIDAFSEESAKAILKQMCRAWEHAV